MGRKELLVTMEDIRFKQQELYLSDMIWQLIEQWRGVILAGIFFAIIALVVFCVRNNNQMSDDVSAEGAATMDTEYEGTYGKISDVLSKYSNYMWLKSNYDNSFWNTNDYSDSKYVTSIYKYNIKGNETDIYFLTSVYSSILDDEEFNDAILNVANRFWDDINVNSLNQILEISATQDAFEYEDANGRISVTMLIPKDVDKSEWETVLNEAILSYAARISGLSDANIPKQVYSRIWKADYLSLVQKQNEQFTKIMTARNYYNTAYDGLDENSRQIAIRIIDEMDNSINARDYIMALDNEMKNKEEENTINEANTSGNKIRSLMKYTLAGFAIGCILYLGLLFAYYTLSGVVHNENELYRVSGINNLGGVYEYPYANKWSRFLHDRRVYKYRTRRGKSMKQITDDLISKLRYMDCREITIFSFGDHSNAASTLADTQIECLKENQIETKIIDVEDTVMSINGSSLIGARCALIKIHGNKTRWSSLCQICAVIREYDIPIVGSEYVEV